MNGKNAFTIVELMVAIVILSILANIASSRIGDYTTKARCTEVVVTLSTFERLQSIYLGINGGVGGLSAIGMEVPKSDYFNYEAEIELTQGYIAGGVQTAAAGGNGGNPGGGSTHMTQVCHMTGNSGCHTIEVDVSGWENGLSPQGDVIGPCDETCNGRLQYTASLVASAQRYLTLYCRDGDGVFTEMRSSGTVTRGNTTGGNCGRYMGAWFK